MAASEPTNASPKLVHAQWYSHSEQIYRFVDIYVPAAYEQQGGDTSSDGYLPALYLLQAEGNIHSLRHFLQGQLAYIICFMLNYEFGVGHSLSG